MCLLLLAVDAHPDYKLIIAANRDEFYARATAPAHWWHDENQIFAGRDLQQGGTWLGVTRERRFAALTNFRDPKAYKPDAPSRGALTREFLASAISCEQYLHELAPGSDAYNDFNLVLWDGSDATIFSSRTRYSTQVNPGVIAISNSLPDTPWPKVVVSKSRFGEIVRGRGDLHREAIFALLRERSGAPDDQLPDTGVGLQLERELAPIFIAREGYGTRCSTLVTIDRRGKLDFEERGFAPAGALQHIARLQLT
jgi:uncharacterized protein with NRDE domain